MTTSPPEGPAALAIVNARIRTNDRRRPWADGILLRDGAIALVGSSAEVKKAAGVTIATVDAKGMFAAPAAEGGVLAPGEAADLVLFDREIAPVTSDTVERARLMLAVTDGLVRFDRDGLTP